MAPQTHYTTTRDGRSIAWSAVGDGPIDLRYVPQSVSAMEHIWAHPNDIHAVLDAAGSDLVVGSELHFDARGEHELRGVPGAWRLWAVAA